MPKKPKVVAEEADAEIDEAEAKRQRKLAKRAAKEVAAAEEEEEVPAKKPKKAKKAEEAAAVEEEVDEAEAKRQRKAAKRAAKEAATAEAEQEEVATEKKAKKAKKVVEETEAAEEVDEAEAKRQRKAAKKAAKAAAAEAEAEPAETAEKPKKNKKKDEEAEEAPKAKNSDSATKDSGTGETEKSLKVFIKGLPYSVDEATLRKDFEECGEIAQMQFPLNEEGRPKGFAFITFSAQKGFDAAMKFDNTDYGGRSISVQMATENREKGKGKGKDGKGAGGKGGEGGKGGHDNENTVFVRGLPFSVTEDALKKDFAECGEIERLKLPLNDEGQPKGISFIKYKTQEGVDAALKFDNTEYGGRTIFVSKAGEGGKGKDGKGKGKDGKDGKGKDGKGKGKKGKSKAPSESFAKNTGCIVAGTGEKKTFEDSDDE